MAATIDQTKSIADLGAKILSLQLSIAEKTPEEALREKWALGYCFGAFDGLVGSGDRLANRFCVGHVILLPFDVGLDVSRRHQSYGMAKCLQLARPMVRRGAGLDANQAWRQLLKERQPIVVTLCMVSSSESWEP